MVTSRFEGGRELNAALQDLTKAAAKGAMKRALLKVAEPLLAAYKSNTKRVTGNLIDSEVAGTKLNKRQAKLAKRLGKAEVEVYVGTADPAGIQEEFGLRGNTPNPALRKAWESDGKNVAIDRISPLLMAEIEKATERARRRAARAGR